MNEREQAMRNDYINDQFVKVETKQDWTYKPTVKIHGSNGETHWISIDKEQLEKIKNVLLGVL